MKEIFDKIESLVVQFKGQPPNPLQSWKRLLSEAYYHAEMFGNVFLWVLKSHRDTPNEAYLIPEWAVISQTNQYRIIPHTDSCLPESIRESGVYIQADSVWHWVEKNPSVGGISPLTKADPDGGTLVPENLEEMIEKMKDEVFSVKPGVVFVVKPGISFSPLVETWLEESPDNMTWAKVYGEPKQLYVRRQLVMASEGSRATTPVWINEKSFYMEIKNNSSLPEDDFEKQLAFEDTFGTRAVNERRTIYDLPPFDGPEGEKVVMSDLGQTVINFSRFTDRARRAVQLASQKSNQTGACYIGTEHILFGIAKEGKGIAVQVLKNLGIDNILCEVRAICPSKENHYREVTMAKTPYSPRAEKALIAAVSHADILGHRNVGTEHILLGILMEEDSVGGHFLESKGISAEKVRKEIGNIVAKVFTKEMKTEPDCDTPEVR